MQDYSPLWETMERKGISQYRLLKSGIDNKTLDALKKGKNITMLTLGITAQWALRASADLLPQSRSMKNGKYIQYSRIFHTFACAKISRRISLPHYVVMPLEKLCTILDCTPNEIVRFQNQK